MVKVWVAGDSKGFVCGEIFDRQAKLLSFSRSLFCRLCIVFCFMYVARNTCHRNASLRHRNNMKCGKTLIEGGRVPNGGVGCNETFMQSQ